MSANRNHRTLLVPACAAVLVVAAALATWARGSAATSIAFNHAAHVKAKVDCTTCHLGVMDPAEERLPSISTCAGCHKGPQGKDRVYDELERLQATGEALQWSSHVRQPDHVFFSHPRHVDVAKLECTTCHAQVAALTRPPTASLRPMAMSTCMGCHANHPESAAAKRVTLDCAGCHR